MLQFLPALLLLLVQSQAPADSLDARMQEALWARVSASLSVAGALSELSLEAGFSVAETSKAASDSTSASSPGHRDCVRSSESTSASPLLACACPRDGPGGIGH